MAKFRVHYTFDGEGFTDIEGDSEEEVEEKFHEGDFGDEEETGCNYEVSTITKGE